MITEQTIINNKQINVAVTSKGMTCVLHEIPSSKFKYLQV